MITIDGSHGEGGGQIVRSSLALSLVTGKPVTIENIRARRPRPGLMRQHLTAVQAAARIGQAEVSGDAIGSGRVTFRPKTIRPGDYIFDIGSAGSTMLVLQTMLPALMIADGSSRIVLEGGTHNPFAPPFDFLQRAFVPLIGRLGPRIEMTLERPGFYPAGGGRAVISVQPAAVLKPLELLDRGPIVGRSIRALVANLPRHIGDRECKRAVEQLQWEPACAAVEEISDPPGPGNVLFIEVDCEHVTEVFAAFGKKGRPAEVVAEMCVKHLRRYLEANVPVGVHLADQLILPLAIGAWQGSGGGSFRTLKLSQHATTNIDVVREFVDVDIKVEQQADDDCLVSITSAGAAE